MLRLALTRQARYHERSTADSAHVTVIWRRQLLAAFATGPGCWVDVGVEGRVVVRAPITARAAGAVGLVALVTASTSHDQPPKVQRLDLIESSRAA